MKPFKNDRGQNIGTLDDNGIFRKKVKRSKHLLRVMNAWGIDKSVVDAMAETCKEIRIKEEETGTVYTVDYKTFIDTAVVRNFVGEQMFLPLKYFTIK